MFSYPTLSTFSALSPLIHPTLIHTLSAKQTMNSAKIRLSQCSWWGLIRIGWNMSGFSPEWGNTETLCAVSSFLRMCHFRGVSTLTRPRLTVILSRAPSPSWRLPSQVISSYLTVEREDARAVAAVMIPLLTARVNLVAKATRLWASRIAGIVTLAQVLPSFSGKIQEPEGYFV